MELDLSQISENQDENESSFLQLNEVNSIMNPNSLPIRHITFNTSQQSLPIPLSQIKKQTEIVVHAINLGSILEYIKRKRISFSFQLFKQFILFSSSESSGPPDNDYRFLKGELEIAIEKIEDFRNLRYKIILGKAFEDIKALSRKKLAYRNQLSLEDLCSNIQKCSGSVKVSHFAFFISKLRNIYQEIMIMQAKNKSRQSPVLKLKKERKYSLKICPQNSCSSPQKQLKTQNCQVIKESPIPFYDNFSEYQMKTRRRKSNHHRRESTAKKQSFPQFNIALDSSHHTTLRSYQAQSDILSQQQFNLLLQGERPNKTILCESKRQSLKNSQSNHRKLKFGEVLGEKGASYHIKKLVIVNNYYGENVAKGCKKKKAPYKEEGHNQSRDHNKCGGCKYCKFMRQAEQFRQKISRFSGMPQIS